MFNKLTLKIRSYYNLMSTFLVLISFLILRQLFHVIFLCSSGCFSSVEGQALFFLFSHIAYCCSLGRILTFIINAAVSVIRDGRAFFVLVFALI